MDSEEEVVPTRDEKESNANERKKKQSERANLEISPIEGTRRGSRERRPSVRFEDSEK